MCLFPQPLALVSVHGADQSWNNAIDIINSLLYVTNFHMCVYMCVVRVGMLGVGVACLGTIW